MIKVCSSSECHERGSSAEHNHRRQTSQHIERVPLCWQRMTAFMDPCMIQLGNCKCSLWQHW